jgi:hypothetical protein
MERFRCFATPPILSLAIGRRDIPIALWIRLVPAPLRNRPLDIGIIHLSFLGAAVGDYGLALVEEVQQPIIHALRSHPEFINSISQKIGFRPSQFVTGLFEPAHAVKELVLWVIGNLVQPKDCGTRPIKLRVKDYIGFCHDQPPLLFTFL